MKRVLLVLGLWGFGALMAATALPPDFTVKLSLFCAVAGLLAVCLPVGRPPRRSLGAGLLAASLALMLFAQKELSDYRPVVAQAGKAVWMEASVTGTPTVSDEQLLCEVRVISGDLKPGTRVRFGMPWDDEPPAIGDTVRGTVRLGISETAESSLTAYFSGKASGIYVTAWQQSDGSVRIDSADPDAAEPTDLGQRLAAALRTFRETVRTRLTAALPEDVRAPVSAICLGNRSELDDATTDAFRRSGVSHLLVVSGLHVSLVSMGIYALVRCAGRRKRTASLAALAGLLVFGCLVGWHASVVRACVLNAAVLLGRCFRRPADSVNSLGGGLFVLWLHDPFCVYDLGLWLSFGATAGLLFLYPWLWERVSARLSETGCRSRAGRVLFGCLRSAARVVCVTLAATLPILPLTACFFGSISLIAPLTNLLTVWAAAAILYLACAMLLLCGVGLSFAAFIPAAPITALSRYLIWMTRQLSGIRGAVWNTQNTYVQVWLIGSLLLLWLGWRLCRGRGLRIAAAVCVMLLCAGTLLYTVRMQGVTTLTACNRYGQTTVLAQRDGCTIVIVSGWKQSWKTAAHLLAEQDIAAVDAVIITDSSRIPADEWADFDACTQVGRYWLTGMGLDAAARLLTGRAPVSVAELNGDEPIRFWQDAEWQWERETDSLLFAFGDTRMRIAAKKTASYADDRQEALSVTVFSRTDEPGDDTPLPGQRQVWHTRGQGVWAS